MKRATTQVAREIADVLEQGVHWSRSYTGGGPESDEVVVEGHKLIRQPYMPVLEPTLKRWLLLLAPPPRKRRVKDPRTAKRRATVKELDALCREIVFERDGGLCRDCRTKLAVDWSHCYSRRYKWLRWDLDNSWASCKGCHLNWHHRPADGATWWEDSIGHDAFRALKLRAAKPRKVDLGLVKAYLEGERGKL